MIPSIETIVDDLVAGTITSAQAVGWLHQHAEDAGYWLRDEFAGRAMQAMTASPDLLQVITATQIENGSVDAGVAKRAYEIADAMLAARASNP